jgi:hypothetical protein
MLQRAYVAGTRAAFAKFALNPPTQVDDFVANVESGKDVPDDPSTNKPENWLGSVRENPDSLNLPEEPTALGDPDGRLAIPNRSSGP